MPLLVDEPTSQACGRFRDDADVIVSSRLLYVETAAALGNGAVDGAPNRERASRRSRRRLDQMWSEMDVVEVDEQVVTRAADLAHRFALRGYDAVHFASAEQLDDDDVVAASADQRLLTAWLRLGLATYDVN